ncbi:MAG: CheY-like chemotaxis protein [Candidatus Azotimanducaceae bacterium]|jgi:CheY-like chemotaxis protein
MQPLLKTILVVDDAPDNIQLLSGILKGNYRVKAAVSGMKALEIARKDPAPDLILLDVVMPGMDGYEVCRTLKQDASSAGIPIIFVSGNVSEQERSKGLAMGADAYLNKPVDPTVLFTAINQLI